MTPIQKLETAVRALYDRKDSNRDTWADWLGANHVPVVADNAMALAKKHGANADLARAAALLHDIADVTMKRFDERHETESMNMARDMMQQAGFTVDDIQLAVDDAIRYHGCRGDERPESLEGKCLSTADAMAHFQTDYYVFSTSMLSYRLDLAGIKEWTLKKIERDINNKMFFDDIRAELLPDYQLIKTLFSR